MRLSANLQIFDISQKARVKMVYSFEEVHGMTGWGDMTYNSRRNILAAISVAQEISYHLFKIDTSATRAGQIARLYRKAQWHSQYSTLEENRITSLDIHPNGETIATFDRYGMCLIFDLSTSKCVFHTGATSREYGTLSRCRWSTNTGEQLLYVKFDYNKLNILDVEKKTFLRKNAIQIDNDELGPYWIDVCQSDGNLLASSGEDANIKVFDRRESRIVKNFEGIHSERVFYVKWHPSGEIIASSSNTTAKSTGFQDWQDSLQWNNRRWE